MAFFFHAKATAFGAQFTQPANEVIPSQASVSLAATGGQGFDRVERFNWRNVVSFDEATAYVSGTITEKERGVRKAETLATTRITNLNILNVVRARAITASVISVNQLGTGRESEVSFVASFEDLHIGATRVDADLDLDLYSKHCTYDSFRSMCRSDLETYGRRYGWQEAAETQRRRAISDLKAPGAADDPRLQEAADTQKLDQVPETHGAIRASLIRDYHLTGPKLAPKFGYGFEVPGFGTIYLAEVILKAGHRRLNMLRLEMGSPTIGDGTSNDIEGNGSDIPP